MPAAVALSLVAAACYAVAMVLEQRAASSLGAEAALQVSLLPRLILRPLWALGLLANALGYLVRFLALGLGSLLVVQPLMGASLLLALPAAARLRGERLQRIEWWAAASIVAGLALLVAPVRHEQSSTSTGHDWVLASVVVAALTAALAVVARGREGRGRAVPLATAGGVLLALTAAFTKAASTTARHDLAALPRSPALYALALSGAVGVFLVQSAFAVAPLPASLPALMVAEPVASVLLGQVVFGEHLARSVGGSLVELVGLAVAVGGVAVMAASPSLDRETVAG